MFVRHTFPLKRENFGCHRSKFSDKSINYQVVSPISFFFVTSDYITVYTQPFVPGIYKEKHNISEEPESWPRK